MRWWRPSRRTSTCRWRGASSGGSSRGRAWSSTGSRTAAPAAGSRSPELLLAGDLAGLDARGADVEPLRGLADHRVDGLDVRVEAALRAPVGVRDGVTEARSLAADVAVGSQGRHSKNRRWSRTVVQEQAPG